MSAKILFSNEANVDKNAISEIAKALKEGSLAVFPTETVYGLAANAYDETAIAKIFEAKGRPQDNPLIVHIASIDTLYELASTVPKTALKCAEKFWPGPLTMVLPKTEKVPNAVSAGLSTVAVRMPLNQTARDIIEKSGLPLAAPSANISGSPSPTTAQHVLNDMNGKIDAVVMGESCDVGVESTVITLAGEHPVLLRPGGVTLEQLQEILPDIKVNPAVLSELKANEEAASPGMKYKHYAPKTETFLVEGDTFADFVNRQNGAVAICFSEEAKEIKIPKIIYGSKENSESLAQSIFAVLREIDEKGFDTAYIHAPKKDGIGLAVYNRLIRAAAFKVITL